MVIKTKQSDAVSSYHDVLAEYSGSYSCLSHDIGNFYSDLAQTQQYFQTTVQLAHAIIGASHNLAVCYQQVLTDWEQR